MTTPTSSQPSRRGLLAGAGAAGAAVVAVAALPKSPAVPVAAAPAVPAAADEAGGYRLTAHVQRYYQTAKV